MHLLFLSSLGHHLLTNWSSVIQSFWYPCEKCNKLFVHKTFKHLIQMHRRYGFGFGLGLGFEETLDLDLDCIIQNGFGHGVGILRYLGFGNRYFNQFPPVGIPVGINSHYGNKLENQIPNLGTNISINSHQWECPNSL